MYLPIYNLIAIISGTLLLKLVKPRDYNEIKPPIGKNLETINQSDIILWCPKNNFCVHL